jgi:outer membrane protein assembly factor BamB
MGMRLRAVADVFRPVVPLGVAAFITSHAAFAGQPQPEARLRWLAELGAESVASGPTEPLGTGFAVASVPGATYVFAASTDGSVQKRLRLAADPASPYGTAVAEGGLAVADKQGVVALWALSPRQEPALRWRRDMQDRVTSVGWDGGDLVLVATWKGRLAALSAADGHPLWSADLSGRAEAPAVVNGKAVFVATKAKVLFRLDAATGAVRWKAALPGVALHPPAVLDEAPQLVVCGTWDGQLVAHDALTGRVLWSASLPGRLAGAPVASSESVAAVTADGGVHAYDAKGRLRWTAPGAADGPGTLIWQGPSGAAHSLLSVSKVLVSLDAATGARMLDYPAGAISDLQRRFSEAMLEGTKTYSEAEKHALLEREAFEIPGPLFAPARAFGPYIAFGTEEGWTYFFHAATLRPAARYRAGQPCADSPRFAAGRILAVAGEEAFALEPQSGRPIWRRILGADPGPIAGDATLGVVAGGRLQAVAATDGDLRWSLRGSFRAAAPPAAQADAQAAAPWLVDDGEGSLRALQPPGRIVGEPLAAGGDLLALVPASAPGTALWIAATRDGKVFGVAWEDAPAPGRLVKAWEKVLEGPITELHVAEGRVLVRSEAGALVAFEEATRDESWRMPLSRDERFQAFPHEGALLVLGPAEVRLHDWTTGSVKLQRKVKAPPVGADLRATRLRWLDRWGGAYWMDVAEGGMQAAELGVSLASAEAVPGGFLVATAAGEVGFVEMTEDAPAIESGDASAHSRGERP